MERPREQLIDRVRSSLERAGFFVSDVHAVRPTSFDLVARRDSLLLLIKVLKNIDALDANEAGRLKELGELFPALPLVIGRTSGPMPLETGVVYSRYDVPILAEESLHDYLLKGLPPFLFSSPGGIFARVDGARLRAIRDERQLSLGALASVAGVSRRTIQLYEDGAGGEVEVIERLEAYLGEPIALAIDLFGTPTGRPPAPAPPPAETAPEPAEPGPGRGPGRPGRAVPRTGDAMRDVVLSQLNGMGWEVTVTLRCPFDAFTQGPRPSEEDVLLTSIGSLRAARQRAEILRELARVIEGHVLFVVENAPRVAIDGMPLVTVQELQRHRDRHELVDLLEEREQR